MIVSPARVVRAGRFRGPADNAVAPHALQSRFALRPSGMLLHDAADPWIGPGWKGYPHDAVALRRSALAGMGWNVLRADLPLPLAVIRRDALQGNLRWLQRFASEQGVDLAPHGKTTMSAQLFRLQLEAGAWGITFANVTQARVGLAAGVQRCLIANQVVAAADLAALAGLLRQTHRRARAVPGRFDRATRSDRKLAVGPRRCAGFRGAARAGPAGRPHRLSRPRAGTRAGAAHRRQSGTAAGWHRMLRRAVDQRRQRRGCGPGAAADAAHAHPRPRVCRRGAVRHRTRSSSAPAGQRCSTWWRAI